MLVLVIASNSNYVRAAGTAISNQYIYVKQMAVSYDLFITGLL